MAVGAHGMRHEEPTVQTFDLHNAMTHSNFKPPHYDIGLIKIEPHIVFNDYVSPICPPSDDLKDFPTGTHCFATGWGDTQGKSSCRPTSVYAM